MSPQVRRRPAHNGVLGAGRDATTFVNESARAFVLANAVAELCDIAVRDSYAGIADRRAEPLGRVGGWSRLAHERKDRPPPQ